MTERIQPVTLSVLLRAVVCALLVGGLHFGTGCGSSGPTCEPAPEDFDPEDLNLRKTEEPREYDCTDWKDDVPSNGEGAGYPWGFPDTEVGDMLRRHMLLVFAYGEGVNRLYTCSLFELETVPVEATRLMEEAYYRIPHEDRLQREYLVRAMGHIRHEAPIEPLHQIAMEPVEEESDDNYHEWNGEVMIRYGAATGLGTHGRLGFYEQILPKLEDIVVRHEEEMVQRAAADTLKNQLEYSECQFEDLVTGTRAEWLLEEYYP